jgi:hypothetical protein
MPCRSVMTESCIMHVISSTVHPNFTLATKTSHSKQLWIDSFTDVVQTTIVTPYAFIGWTFSILKTWHTLFLGFPMRQKSLPRNQHASTCSQPKSVDFSLWWYQHTMFHEITTTLWSHIEHTEITFVFYGVSLSHRNDDNYFKNVSEKTHFIKGNKVVVLYTSEEVGPEVDAKKLYELICRQQTAGQNYWSV